MWPLFRWDGGSKKGVGVTSQLGQFLPNNYNQILSSSFSLKSHTQLCIKNNPDLSNFVSG